LFKDAHLQAFDSVVRELNISAYLCGGTVRDLLLNRRIHDIDVVLSGHVFEAAELFRTKLNAPSFVLDEERQVARVVAGAGNWDFSGFRNRTIEGDLRKRDFTINAMASPWESFYPSRGLGTILDPFDGQTDLKKRKIRTVTPESFQDDPLRMLRAFRISAELGFDIDPDVLQQIEGFADKIQGVAAERVTEELNRVFLQSNSAQAWKILGESKLLGAIFPEMAAMKGCDQGGYHHLDVWGHSLLTLENFEQLLQNLKEIFPEHAQQLEEYLNAVPGSLDRRRLLKWASLLHDIGKPQTRELREPGRWRFHGHDHAGAASAEILLKRLKFARKDVQLIALMIEHHLRPLNLFNQDLLDPNDFYKFFRSTGAEAIAVLLVSIADIQAAHGPLADPKRIPEFINMIRDLLIYYFREYYPAINTPELIKGRDLMAILQMKPGPLMGELLKEIREAQFTGVLTSRDEALAFARKWLKNRT
jgi:poly(A) polymerase